MSKIAIGIDLGTTYSCVGVWLNDKVEIIANDQGNRTTPSYVAFKSDGDTSHETKLIGDSAKNQAVANSVNTIFDVKRLIGKNFDDPTIKSDMKYWPFNVVNQNNKPYIAINNKLYSPEEISAMILMKMKQIASNFIGKEITDAVITVPAYFNDSQRQATANAGKIAGLNVLRIINEPTAAALAYDLNKSVKKKINILVYDFGGGTLDCTILSVENGVFEVKATSGNCHLGGEDIDNILVDYCLVEFKKKCPKFLPNPKIIKKLKVICEQTKRILSGSVEAIIEADSIFDGQDLIINMNRAKFENLCLGIFKKALEPVNEVITDSGLDKSEIDEIVLVGGSTRIPKIKQMLSEYFGGKKLSESVNPDEAVAYGAAIQAAILSGESSKKIDGLVLLDVTALSLGIETVGGLMTNIIDRNTTIPCKRTKTFTTYSDSQPEVSVKIFEGERKFVKDNNNLGTFKFGGIIPAPRGIPRIDVTFELDSNGILNVMALDKASSRKQNLVITNSKNGLSEKDIERMISEAKKFEEEDNAKRILIETKNQLEIYVCNVKQTTTEPSFVKYMNPTDKMKIENMCAQLLQDLSTNGEDYETKKSELENVWNPIVSDVYTKISMENNK